MKLLLTLFILLCSHLAGGHGTVYGSSHTGETAHASTRDTGKPAVADRTGGGHSCLLTNHPGLPGEPELLLFEEDDEDDERNGKLPLESFSTLFHAFISTYPYRDLTNRLSLRRHPSYSGSCKYIAQRVLRI